MVCHYKVVITNLLERSSASSAPVQTTAHRFMWSALEVYTCLKVGSFIPLSSFAATAFSATAFSATAFSASLLSSHHPHLMLARCLHTHPYSDLSFWQAVNRLNFFLASTLLSAMLPIAHCLLAPPVPGTFQQHLSGFHVTIK